MLLVEVKGSDGGARPTLVVFCNDRRAHGEHLIEDVEQDDFPYILEKGQRWVRGGDGVA